MAVATNAARGRPSSPLKKFCISVVLGSAPGALIVWLFDLVIRSVDPVVSASWYVFYFAFSVLIFAPLVVFIFGRLNYAVLAVVCFVYFGVSFYVSKLLI